MNDVKRAKELRQSVNVLVVLAVLTAVEFWLAVTTQMWALLVVIALVKAGLVIQYYMHLPRVFAEEGGH